MLNEMADSQKTIIVWYRNDLRVHDHPALARAAADAAHVIPVFVFNDRILTGRHAGSNRNRFLLESLADLKTSLKTIGGDLVYRHGDAADELIGLARDHGATDVYYTADYTSYAIARDRSVEKALREAGIEPRGFAGRTLVSKLNDITTNAGEPQRVFTPFYRKWLAVGRRDVAEVPQAIKLPSTVRLGTAPKLDDITEKDDLSPGVLRGGETEGLKRLDAFLDGHINDYSWTNNDLAADRTSRLSSYLHFGCVSPLQIESRLGHSKGAESWRRQLAWSDFYNYVLLKFPANAHQEFQEKYRGKLAWADTAKGEGKKLLGAWQAGQTGYPIVDAAMRQLRQEGWMHNRARLIVGSFLTKDLWLDWREGETYFMRMLTDGDEANNNGNWQWIASVGVDPAPVFRRLYNPASQMKNYDPDGEYIRRYVPELADVPLKYLAEPWTMSPEQQQEAGCAIGTDYPKPVVDHKEAREYALARYAGL